MVNCNVNTLQLRHKITSHYIQSYVLNPQHKKDLLFYVDIQTFIVCEKIEFLSDLAFDFLRMKKKRCWCILITLFAKAHKS